MKSFLRLSSYAAVTLLLPCLAARADLITAVAVVVDESVITLGEIQMNVSRAAEAVAPKYQNNEPAYRQEVMKLHDEAIEAMVEDKLVLHAFAVAGYATNVVDAIIDDEIQRKIKEQYYGDRSRLIQSLHAKGQTYEMYRREVKDEFIINWMNFQNISNPHKILISPLRIEEYYEGHKNEFKVDDQVKVSMIVLPKAADSAPGSVRKLGEEILTKIDSGVPFSEMASVYSSGLQRAEGGERGWVDRNTFKSSLTAVAFSLKPGQHSGIIEEPEACYILLVEDARPAHVKDIKDVRDDIERTLKNKENVRLRQLWIDRLKRKSYVNYY